jgi:hypothetical protein
MLLPQKVTEDIARRVLTDEAARWFSRLIWATRLVVIGVVVEGIAVFHEVVDVVKKWLQRRKDRADITTLREIFPVSETVNGTELESHAPTWVKVVAFIGLISVAVGVAGEWKYEVKFEAATDAIQTFDNNRVTEAQKQAGDAAESAKSAKASADAVGKEAAGIDTRLQIASRELGVFEKDVIAQGPRAKLLAKAAPNLVRELRPFAGQRVGLYVCGQQGLAEQETIDTWGAIASILDADTVAGLTGAKWKLVPSNLNFTGNCGAAKGLGQGAAVFVSKRATSRTIDAANALGHGLSNILPPSPTKIPILIDPDFAKLAVDRGLQTKETPWNIVGYDPELITVMLGEHP